MLLLLPVVPAWLAAAGSWIRGAAQWLNQTDPTREKSKSKPIHNLLSALARYVYEDLDPHSGSRGGRDTARERGYRWVQHLAVQTLT